MRNFWSTLGCQVTELLPSHLQLRHALDLHLGQLLSCCFCCHSASLQMFLDEQWSIMVSAANYDRETTENSYWPTVSFMSISGHHTREKQPILFALIFFVRCFLFIGDQRLTSPDWTPSFTKESNRLLLISLCSHKSFIFTFLTTLVTGLNSSVCASVNGFVNLPIVAVNCATPFSSRAKTPAVRLWWRS